MSKNKNNEKLDLILNKLTELEKMNEKIEKLETLNEKIEKLENKIIIESHQIKPENKEKYDVILKIVNNILLMNDKPNIKQLIDLKNIERELFLNINIDEVITKYKDEIFKVGFTKVQIRWYMKSKIKNYILTFLKYACDDIGLDFRSKEVCQKILGKYKRYMVYDIIVKY